MAFLELTLFEHPKGLEFDLETVLRRLKEAITDLVLIPGDQSAAEMQRAENLFAAELRANPESPARNVVESLRRKARIYGPTYALKILSDDGRTIRGLARRFSVEFRFDDPLPELWRGRLVQFLKSLGAGKLRASTNDRRQFEVLCDLPGESDCTRERQEVVWK